MNHASYATVLVGFNPPQLAKSLVVSGWGTSFHAVVQELQRKASETTHQFQRHFVITPVVGPEAVQVCIPYYQEVLRTSRLLTPLVVRAPLFVHALIPTCHSASHVCHTHRV
eukprot:6279708-Pyramimonas_sp.AAC.2